MKQLMQILTTLVAWGSGIPLVKHHGEFFTCDSTAIKFRIPAGNPGDITRTHPVSIEPCLIDANSPPLILGQAVLVDAATKGVRPYGGGDAGVVVAYGTVVRSYPTSPGGTVTAPGAAASLGSGTPPGSGTIDIMRSGYMMVKIPAAQAAVPGKQGAVFVRIAAAAADQPIGGFEAQADGGNTVALDVNRYSFNGPADPSGNVEIAWNI